MKVANGAARPDPRADRVRAMGVGPALLANGLVIGVLACFYLLEEYSSDLFYRSVQEDEALEWATFWAFLAAAALCVWGAVRQRRATGTVPWFFVGVAAFCFTVAMEEISWGQRVLGYRPPPYFLEHNFQQELNVHNVIDTKLRKMAVKAVIAGYGIALPLLALVPPLGRLFRRLAVVVPPPELIPGFAVTYWAYETYPFRFAGEVVEFMLGLGFLFAALVRLGDLAGTRSPSPWWGRRAARLGACFALVVALGAANAWASRSQRGVAPENLERARAELEALRRDFLAEAARDDDEAPTHCGLHKRLYTFRQEYGAEFLVEGEFAALTSQGLPEERAEFLLDPWNSPYWLRHRCSKSSGRIRAFVYSLGPNRRRESTRREVLGDDVAVFLLDGRDWRDEVAASAQP